MTEQVLFETGAVLSGFIFKLDMQLVFDLLFQGVAVLILFTAVGYLLINPAKKMIADRQAKIEGDLKSAADDKEQAEKLKEEYDVKMAGVDKEADKILADARRKALKNEEQIVSEAKTEAARIVSSAKKEAELEKNRVKDEVRVEMIQVASIMAGKIVEREIDPARQESLIDEALKEMGDEVWQSK